MVYPVNTHILSGILTGNNEYLAKQTISSTQVINSGHTSYKAGSSITLLPGFKVEAGANFTATIADIDCADMMKNQKSIVSTIGDIDKIEEKETSPKILSDNKPDIKVFPNPNNGTFTINTNFNPQEIISVQVFSIVGQSIYKQEGLPNNVIQLPETTKGMFFVEIKTQSEKFVRKMEVN